MRKSLLFACGLATIVLGMSFESVERIEGKANVTSAPAGHTGSPGDGLVCTACHFGPAVATKTDIITSDIPSGGYVPGNTYTISVTLNANGHTRFGYQLSPQTNAGAMVGTWGNPINANTTKVGSGKYFTHTFAGTAGTNTKTWTMNWTAPSTGVGAVTFYGAFNIANGDNNTTGDTIWKSTMVVPQDGVNSVLPLEDNSFRSFVNASNELVLEGNANVLLPADIALYDLSGRLVIDWKAQSFIGNSWSATLPVVNAGIYLLKVKQGNIVKGSKLYIGN